MSQSQQRPLLYIGENLMGTTSRHRRLILEELIEGDAVVVDFNAFLPSHRVLKSVVWRCHNLVRLTRFNRELSSRLEGVRYRVCWIDKGMFLTNRSLLKLRRQCEILIFFTPDCFFYKNNVWSVERKLDLFDKVATTKSFEMNRFQSCLNIKSSLQCVMQGYTPLKNFEKLKSLKRDIDVLFIGKFEKARGQLIKGLADRGVVVHVGGAGWKRRSSLLSHRNVIFIGDDLRGETYSDFYRRAKIGLGLISKEFPELHTTRTFEIPYFGAALATEKNSETSSFFDDGEVIFYESDDELCSQVISCLKSGAWRQLGESGSMRIRKGGYSWKDQLVRVSRSAGFYDRAIP